MGKKSFVVKNKKATKLLKCDGQLLKKILIDKGFIPTDLSRMMDYCPDYLNRCIRRNEISDVCAKKLIDYKIFPRMYNVEGDIVTKDDVKAAGGLENLEEELGVEQTKSWVKNEMRGMLNEEFSRDLRKELGFSNNNRELSENQKEKLKYFLNNEGILPEREHGLPKEEKDPFSPTAEDIKRKLNAKFGYWPAPEKDTIRPGDHGYMLVQGFKHFFNGIMMEIKNDPEFKELIKQAVKEAFKEL